MAEKLTADIYDLPTKNGAFERPRSVFNSRISSRPGSQFPAEKDRYVLYINMGCPWASRTNLVRTLKGLESIIQLVVLDWELFPHGWSFTGRDGTATKDPLYGFTQLSELYFKANPEYDGRYTVPVLWDKKLETVVSNESSDIIRMLYEEFDTLLPKERREANKLAGSTIRSTMGSIVPGLQQHKRAYEDAVKKLFVSLDGVEEILSESEGPYLFGKYITEADIRLYPTIARFDVAYYTLLICNFWMIKEHYPEIQKWFQRLYWDESEETRGAFRKSTDFNAIKKGYAATPRKQFVPLDPAVEAPQRNM